MRGRRVGQAAMLGAMLVWTVPIHGQETEPVELTMESAVAMGMEQSYRVRQLRLGIERTRSILGAERARMKTRIDLSVDAPEYQIISDYEYDSELGRDVLVRENSRRWQANLAVRQPVILFGYPTNGYLSLNSRVYRYTQIQDEEEFTRYYNRYYVAYEQPLFQPNELKNELQEAEYDLEGAEMDFRQNVVGLIDDVADDYYDLFEVRYREETLLDHVERLERAVGVARELAETDAGREDDVAQMQVELANARERVQQARSTFRLQSARMKQRLRLDPGDSLVVRPVLDVQPVEVDVERAVRYGLTLRPRLRELEIRMWENERSLEETRARNSFRLDLEFTAGREMAAEVFGDIWQEPRNSYTVQVNADIPIWDWGERSARVHAAEIRLEQTELDMDETRAEIRSEIANAVQNLEAFQSRALVMEDNLRLAEDLAETALARYGRSEISTLELLRSLDRAAETAGNFLDTYLGYRQALLDLQRMTYYDFEKDAPLLDRFEVTAQDRQ